MIVCANLSQEFAAHFGADDELLAAVDAVLLGHVAVGEVLGQLVEVRHAALLYRHPPLVVLQVVAARRRQAPMAGSGRSSRGGHRQ